MSTPKASLKPHLGDIRAWVAQGRTDIWIAHTLNSTPASISAFRSAHGILRRNLPGEVAGTAVPPPVVPPDAKEPEPAPKPRRRSRRRTTAAEGGRASRVAASADQGAAGNGAPKRRSRARRAEPAEAASRPAEAAAPADQAPVGEERPARRRSRRSGAAKEAAAVEATAAPEPAAPADQAPSGEEAPRRRRRGSRGGRSRRATHVFEAVLDHGDEGYGFWLDGAVRNDDVFREHWGGRRALVVTIEPDQIVVRPDERAAGSPDTDA